jgi:hypothetical protein
LERSLQGLDGKKPSKNKPAKFKAERLLVQDKTSSILYEIGQFSKMNIYLRPQVLLVNGKFFIEGDDNDDIQTFVKKFHDWRSVNSCLVFSNDIKRGAVKKYLKIVEDQGQFTANTILEDLKIKDEILIDIFPETDKLFHYLTPRIYWDDNQSKPILRVRAKTADEAISFIISLLIIKEEIFSNPDKDIDDSYINVSMSFSISMFERAIVKIVLNCLMHYYPESKDYQELEPLLKYVKYGGTNRGIQFRDKNKFLDLEGSNHIISFYQTNDALHVRINLFSGSFVFGFFIPGIQLMPFRTYSRIIVDYQKRTHTFQDKVSFTLENFNLSDIEQLGLRS